MSLDQIKKLIDEQVKKALELNNSEVHLVKIDLSGIDIGENSVSVFEYIAKKYPALGKDLSLISCKIINLQGIGRIQNLKELELGNNQITDISPLKDLQELVALDLRKNSISNISILLSKTIPNLQLDDNYIDIIDLERVKCQGQSQKGSREDYKILLQSAILKAVIEANKLKRVAIELQKITMKSQIKQKEDYSCFYFY